MAFFSSGTITAAQLGPVPVCIRSAYADSRELLHTVLAGAPSQVDAERLAHEHGLRLYRVGEQWYLGPLGDT